MTAAPASAQTATAQTVTASLENVTRVESWTFFQPPPSGGSDSRYTFPATRVRFGVDVEGRHVALSGALNYVRTENLPTGAIGPLALGSGGFYFASAGTPYSYQLFFSELTLTAFTADRRLAFRAGRMPYGSGVEASSRDQRIDAVKRLRLDGRLIGGFEWAMYQRRFDGVRVDVNRPAFQATAAVMMPTQGGYEESANLTLTRVQTGGGAVAFRPGAATPRGELQVFAYAYRDRRDIQIRPDNSGLLAAAADVTVTSVGGSHVAALPTRAGDVDTLVWGAAEFGDWYGEPHRAYSLAFEGGHRWTNARWQPWLRAGALVASGDDDPGDGRHGTFFPMLPSARTYALSAVYTPMNLRDLFVQTWLDGGSRWRARVDLHRLDLMNTADRWYHGSGATARDGLFFGFSGRQSGGATSLGTILEGTLDVTLAKYWSMNVYAGRMWGGDVVRASFVTDRLLFWYVENVIGF